MSTLETLTKSDLQSILKPKSLRRARGYIHSVQNPVRSGQTLAAQVRGSHLYQVEIEAGPGGVSAICSCSYNWGGYCKHIGAVLLKWIQSPGDFTVVNVLPRSANEYPIETILVNPPPARQPDQPPFWLTSPFAGRIHADEEELLQWLNNVRLQDLRRIAKQHSWKVKGTRKADIASQILEHVTNPDDTLDASRNLDEEHRAVLIALVLLGPSSKIRQDALENAANGLKKLDNYQNISTYTHHLFELGLTLPGSMLPGYYNKSGFVPRAVARVLPPVLRDVVPTAAHPRTNIGEIRLADPYPFIRTANQIVLLLEQHPTPLRPPMPRPKMERFFYGLKEWDYDPHELARLKSGGKLNSRETTVAVPPPARSLPDEAIKRLAPVAGGAERLEFIYSLLVAADIIQYGSPVTIWRKAKEQFLRQSELAQRAVLAQIYFRMLNWSALWEILRKGKLQLRRVLSDRYVNIKPDDLRTQLLLFRNIALRGLASLPDGEWIALDDLLHPMRAIWPRFDHSVWQEYWQPSSKPSWFLVQDSHPLSPDSADDWELAQGSFIRQIIAGPLHWLGLADLCFDDGRLAAARFHGLADLYWDRVEIPDAPPAASAQTPSLPPEEAVSTAGHTITVVPAAISPQAHDLLNKIARLEFAAAEQFVYHLDSQTTFESFEAGAALSELNDSWEKLLPIPMPKAIRDQLTAWWDAYGQVRIYENVTIVELDDYALAEMKAVTPVEEYIIAEISPRLIIIPEKAVAPLIEALEKAGYTPKQTDEV